MKKIPVENIEEGMILARDVQGRSGNILLSKGVALNPFLGRRLKNWDIQVVHVEGEDESVEEKSVVQVSPGELKAALEKKFSKVMHNHVMKQIFAAVYQFKAQNNNG